MAFIDLDDLWHREKLTIQLNYMVKINIYKSYSHNNDKNGFKIGYREARKIEYKDLIKSDIGLSTVMIKKALLKKFLCKIKN